MDISRTSNSTRILPVPVVHTILLSSLPDVESGQDGQNAIGGSFHPWRSVECTGMKVVEDSRENDD